MTATTPIPVDAAPPLTAWLEKAWSHKAALREVEVEGATVRYREWGAGKGRPGLVLVHGFLAHARWWDHIAPHFADRFHVIAPDFTGMGDSDRRPEYSRRQYGRETLAAIVDAGMHGATVAAHSFGAVSSLFAAMLAPDRIARTIVIDAHVFRGENEDADRAVEAEKRYPTFEDALSRYRPMPPGAWPNPDIRAYFARHSLRQYADGWGWKFDPETFRSVHREAIRDDVRGIALPVDFIHAEQSEVVGPAELAAFMANAPGCPGAVTVPLSHHHIMLEQPVGLIAALNALLARPPLPAGGKPSQQLAR